MKGKEEEEGKERKDNEDNIFFKIIDITTKIVNTKYRIVIKIQCEENLIC